MLHYPKGIEIEKYDGTIRNIDENDYQMEHFCSSSPGSSGGPLFYLRNQKLIGIHKGAAIKGKEYNYGTFLKLPIEEFNEILSQNTNLKEKADNEISISIISYSNIKNNNDDKNNVTNNVNDKINNNNAKAKANINGYKNNNTNNDFIIINDDNINEDKNNNNNTNNDNKDDNINDCKNNNINKEDHKEIDDLINALIKYGLDADGPYILNILNVFDNLLKNKNLIEPFILNKGVDSLIKVMKQIDNNYNNANIILKLFSILKKY